MLLTLVAACGGAATSGGPAEAPPSQGPPPFVGDGGTTAPAPPATGGQGQVGAPTPSVSAAGPQTSPVAPAVPSVEMKPIAHSALGAELAAVGLDPAHLPPLEKLEPRSLRGVMKLMARSLGVPCRGCHEEGDFAAPTPRKKVATRMWNEFVVKLAMADGTPLFCDSCHQGRVVQLDRSDKKALSKWMDENFVSGLSRKDGASEECESCHVDMNMRFLSDWAR